MSIKNLASTIILCLGTMFTYAQKLPNVQLAGVRAPKNVNIDGKDAEWGSEFQAYNHATDLYYTISNDDENLYLILEAEDTDVLLKIFGKGFTWNIDLPDGKSNQKHASITYPVLPHTGYMQLTKKKTEGDKSADEVAAWVSRNNKMLNDSCKYIGVSGVPNIDTLTSVYNRDGIKVKGLFNDKKVYVCEFSIKLKLLNISQNEGQSLKYRVQINGMKPIASIVMPPNPTPEMLERVEKATQFLNKELAPTFFQGDYTLIKKSNN